MITIELSVDDLADTRFAISPLVETVLSLWALREPAFYSYLPVQLLRGDLDGLDTSLLTCLVGPTFALPDFLTPRPSVFGAKFDDELATVRGTPPAIVRRDLMAVYDQGRRPLPGPLADAEATGDRPVRALLDRICDLLAQYWAVAVQRHWPLIRLVLEADTTYRAHQLATGGARLLFADMHPNISWHNGVLRIDKMLGEHHVIAAGRGLLLVPSLFAYKPVPPVSRDEPPWLAYPTRGSATLFEGSSHDGSSALAGLIGAPRARLLGMLDNPRSTVEIAQQLGVTPSAVSQHLRVLHANALVTRTRHARHVLYRRSPLGDELSTSR